MPKKVHFRLPANATQATTARALRPISNDLMCLFDFPLARYVAHVPADCKNLKKRKKMHPALTFSVCCQMVTHGHLYCVLALPYNVFACASYIETEGAQRF